MKEENAEIICIQEIHKNEVEFISKSLGCQYYVFGPMSPIVYTRPEDKREMVYFLDQISKISRGELLSRDFAMTAAGVVVFSKSLFQIFPSNFMLWRTGQ